jgi:hypothetical protein
MIPVIATISFFPIEEAQNRQSVLPSAFIYGFLSNTTGLCKEWLIKFRNLTAFSQFAPKTVDSLLRRRERAQFVVANPRRVSLAFDPSEP